MTTATEPTTAELLSAILIAVRGLDARMERMEERMERMEQRMDTLEGVVVRLREHVAGLRSDVADLSVLVRERVPAS